LAKKTVFVQALNRVKEEGNTWSGDSDQRKLLPLKPPPFPFTDASPAGIRGKKKPFKLLKLEGLHPVYLTLNASINIQHPVSPQRDEYMLRQVF